jgi:RNA polymerase sigma factor (sigma-70 family)
MSADSPSSDGKPTAAHPKKGWRVPLPEPSTTTPTGPDPRGLIPQESLFAAAVRGEQDALCALWEANRRWVAAIILAHKPAWADTDDILQDVASTLLRKIGQVRDPAAFAPWLKMVATNAARAASRDLSQRRKVSPIARIGGGEDHLETLVGASTAESAADRERLEHGRRLLELSADLPEGYREPLLLRCVQGMSYTQIAQVLELPETTIETRIARGRRMLRDAARKGGLEAAIVETSPRDLTEGAGSRISLSRGTR